MQKSKFTRNRSNSCNNTSLSDFQTEPKIRSHSLSLPSSNASSIRNKNSETEKHRIENNVTINKRSKNPIIKIIHSFKRTEDVDLETGET